MCLLKTLTLLRLFFLNFLLCYPDSKAPDIPVPVSHTFFYPRTDTPLLKLSPTLQGTWLVPVHKSHSSDTVPFLAG